MRLQGIVLVYDVTSRESFSTVDYWMKNIDQDVDCSDAEPVPVYLIGNKIDLESKREVTKQMGKAVRTKFRTTSNNFDLNAFELC